MLSLTLAAFVIGPETGEEGPFQVRACSVEFPDQPAGVHQQHTIGDTGHLVEVMTADEDRRTRPRPAQQLLAQQDHRGRVEGVARFVEDDHARIVLHRCGEADSLPVARGQAPEPSVGQRRQPPSLQRRGHLRRRSSVQPRGQAQVLLSRELRVGQGHVDQRADTGER